MFRFFPQHPFRTPSTHLSPCMWKTNYTLIRNKTIIYWQLRIRQQKEQLWWSDLCFCMYSGSVFRNITTSWLSHQRLVLYWLLVNGIDLVLGWRPRWEVIISSPLHLMTSFVLARYLLFSLLYETLENPSGKICSPSLFPPFLHPP
jgi:hypothetical protein